MTSRPKSPASTPPLLTITQFYEALGGALGINAIRSAVRDGRIRSLLAGERKRLIPATELVDWPQRESGVTR
jgi:hypothetical protein